MHVYKVIMKSCNVLVSWLLCSWNRISGVFWCIGANYSVMTIASEAQ